MMSVRRGILTAVAVVAVVLLGLVIRREASRSAAAGAGTGPARIVALSPGMTATLFAIGAGAQVVGVSDYCDYPPGATRLPRAGTAITPSYETIARLAPTLIIAEGKTHEAELSAIAPTRVLPWLSLDDITNSTRKLGQLTRHAADAAQLAATLRARLSVKPPPGAPRVLLVLGYTPGKLDEVWFVKPDSIHGAALAAAGGKNAVAQAPQGPPRLSLARVIEIDPDQIIILTTSTRDADAKLFRESWSKLTPLAAVRAGRIGVLGGKETYADGPRILDLVDRLAAEIKQLEAKK